MSDAYIIAGARTPIGGFLGSLSTLTATQLGAIAIESAVKSSALAADQFDEAIMGNVLSTGLGQAPARQAALQAGLTFDDRCGDREQGLRLGSKIRHDGGAGDSLRRCQGDCCGWNGEHEQRTSLCSTLANRSKAWRSCRWSIRWSTMA